MTAVRFNEATGEFFLPKLRLVYPKLLTPEINKKYPNNPPKFSSLGLIRAEDDISLLNAEVAKLAVSLWGATWKETGQEDPGKAVKLPVKKTKFNERIAEYAEAFPFYVSVGANREYPPVVFGPDKTKYDETKHGAIYGGRWAIFAVDVWGPTPDKKDVNRFISIGLKRAQLLDHDEPIATGRIGTADGFEVADVGAATKAGGNGSADDLF
jgi:hypothetical protein